MKITNTYEYQKLRGLKRKMELIQMKGGCCQNCGYNKNVAAFDFHHKDPFSKEFDLDMRKLSNTTMVKLMKEVEKCELLCANCHREVHSPDLEIINVKSLIKSVDDSVLELKEFNKPKCVDCGCEINYTHKRCVKCNNINKRKTERPSLETLLREIKEHSQEWCSKKYGVSRSSIRRWVLSYTACSSMEECHSDIMESDGSIPSMPTKKSLIEISKVCNDINTAG